VLLTTLVLVWVYWSVKDADFNWDDEAHITANPAVIGPQGLQDIWTSGKANYFPLTMTSFWVQHQLWGLEPGPYHMVTAAFHLGAALLLWRVLRALAVPGAWLGALLWAVHPVQVESVAWICELKNTQSAVFYLLAVLWFVHWVRTPGPLRADGRYAAAVGAALLAILSKSSTVMLPVVLGLIGWWLGRRRGRDAVWLAPFFLLSLAASGWTIWEQKVNQMALGPDWAHGLAARLTIAGKAPWFYLGKLLWPEPLIFIYPRWPVAGLGLADGVPLAGTAALGVALWRMRDGPGRSVFLALTYFFVSLFPVLGLFDVFFFKYSFVGDHFQYLASMGPLALLAAAGTRLAATWPSRRRRWAVAAAGGVVLALAGMARAQTAIYANRFTLWADTVARNPQAWIAQMNLGNEFLARQQGMDALRHYEAALRLRPGDPWTEMNLGTVLVQLGRNAEALPYLERGLRQQPGVAAGHNSLGVALRATGRKREAGQRFARALELDPGYAAARINAVATLAELADAAAAAGDRNAEADALAALARLQPAEPVWRRRLGAALFLADRPSEAVAPYEWLVRQAPDAAAHNDLGSALFRAGRADEAIAQWERACALDPDLRSARLNLIQVLAYLGRRDAALARTRALLERMPGDPAGLELLQKLGVPPGGASAPNLSPP
jgi:tetratricopeptide (TPR) repeat protein